MEWIRQQPCLICGKRPVEAHHYGPRAFGRKASDSQAIPLCREHHQWPNPEAVHTLGKRWAQHHGIDVEAAIKRLHQSYHETQSAIYPGRAK